MNVFKGMQIKVHLNEDDYTHSEIQTDLNLNEPRDILPKQFEINGGIANLS